MAESKTTETEKSVVEFINNITDEVRRNDCLELINIIKKLTKVEPKMWGPSIIGFGCHHYKVSSRPTTSWLQK